MRWGCPGRSTASSTRSSPSKGVQFKVYLLNKMLRQVIAGMSDQAYWKQVARLVVRPLKVNRPALFQVIPCGVTSAARLTRMLALDSGVGQTPANVCATRNIHASFC
ncbi:hypothetical protein EDP1_868 [Pseudomonas putida S610]|nr:hypothetical protein EDP1_868 [Pseudomonas putida S610]